MKLSRNSLNVSFGERKSSRRFSIPLPRSLKSKIAGSANAKTEKDAKKMSREDYLSNLDQRIQSSVANKKQQKIRITERIKSLPCTSYFSSNHILINNERVAVHLPPLVRKREIDNEARKHAEIEAAKGHTFHSGESDCYKDNPDEIQNVGKVIGRGKSMRDAHQNIMDLVSNRRCVLNPTFTTMGTGSMKGEGGMLYVCYVFQT
uniref:SCP domain-containing protein n=1 Tax=Ditylum brightwellii TaxID=49249 RepID=A0A7S2A0F4_9STRA|mmetsp:Transcript_5606/g.8514  ORF Transcript_5606/g.8514 Transcript_5606/m.8514 type:complete len:205 (+) Transcript_5606:189-803(+)